VRKIAARQPIVAAMAKTIAWRITRRTGPSRGPGPVARPSRGAVAHGVAEDRVDADDGAAAPRRRTWPGSGVEARLGDLASTELQVVRTAATGRRIMERTIERKVPSAAAGGELRAEGDVLRRQLLCRYG
jgi:hypothetical protein